jgi:hypothetical protein
MGKLRIVAVVQYPITNLFDTLYIEHKNTGFFDFKFVIIPSKQPGSDVGEFKLKDMVGFMKKKKYPYIKGYDEINNSYYDLKKLKPDLVFLQTPYDLQRISPIYSSEYIKNFAKVANISYGAIMIKLKGIYANLYENNPFVKNCWKIFVENDEMKEIFDNIMPDKAVSVGYMKCDYFLNYTNKIDYPEHWSLSRKKSFRIVWKPRWIAKNTHSNLFKYLYYFIYLIENNPRVDFVWYMHPFIKSQIKNNKLMTETELNNVLKKIKLLPNFKIEDSGDFLECIFGADLYIGGASSTFTEFSLTGKPIIYTSSMADKLNSFGKKIIKGAYIVKNNVEMTQKIHELLRNEDPLKNIRQQNKKIISKKDFKNRTIAQVILEYIKKNL